MSKDLQSSQWLQYDQNFREWAAAKGITKWGELNFSIYGRCLATQQPGVQNCRPLVNRREKQTPMCASVETMGPHAISPPVVLPIEVGTVHGFTRQ